MLNDRLFRWSPGIHGFLESSWAILMISQDRESLDPALHQVPSFQNILGFGSPGKNEGVLAAQSSIALWGLKGCSLSGSPVQGILQARMLEWVAIPFSRRSFQQRDWTQISCIAGRFFTFWATRDASRQNVYPHTKEWNLTFILYYEQNSTQNGLKT